MRALDIPARLYRSMYRAMRTIACVWPFENTRPWMYRRVVKKLGRRTTIMPLVFCHYGTNLIIGDDVFINTGVILEDAGGITIGDGTHIGCRAVIMTTSHKYEEGGLNDIELMPVTVGKDVWIGASSTIFPGITIGDGAVVGAGAVVTSDVPPFDVVAGVPAKKIKTRKTERSS